MFDGLSGSTLGVSSVSCKQTNKQTNKQIKEQSNNNTLVYSTSIQNVADRSESNI